ncbi:MAG: hypothetical protein JWP02_3335 [Acidimicrobiales bacterium]|nr:hypothetical protein [Acidimicrobiales bacterium]
MRGGIEVTSSPLVLSGPPDLGIVDALARLQLAARRLGCAVRVFGACDELRELLDLAGLRQLLGSDEELGIEMGRQTEELEQARVEEVVQPGDPVA